MYVYAIYGVSIWAYLAGQADFYNLSTWLAMPGPRLPHPGSVTQSTSEMPLGRRQRWMQTAFGMELPIRRLRIVF